MKKLLFFIFGITILFGCQPKQAQEPITPTTDYESLILLFKDWRQFEIPPLREGAPDYSAATFEKRMPVFNQLRSRLLSIDTAGWPIDQKVDWHLVWAEMNGFEFNHRVLRPWERDPAYYKVIWTERSDVPAHEGPTNHGIIDLWRYEFPLSLEGKVRLIKELKIIPAFYEQAKVNLTGNAKDLWVAGIRDIKSQVDDLNNIMQLPGVNEQANLVSAIQDAIHATEDLANWLEKESTKKTGPSGIGKDNYTWYLQNVNLIPMTWEDEVMLLKRELSRAWASLKLEEHQNRNLPPLVAANSPEAFNLLAEESAKKLLTFLEKDDIVTVKDYFEPALREHLGQFVPAEKRNFFIITLHHDPRPLYSHFYHWFELARMDLEPHPSPIRSGPLLYNIFAARNEGTATAVEEMFLQAGLYRDDPRVREIVYIMIAQRAARGLGSLYAHANLLTMEEAGKIHSEFTPRGWMKTEKELLLFEQHLYLRQPGYGSSYITGKYLLENLMADYARKKELKNEEFKLKNFFDGLNAIDCIPFSLVKWEMTGNDEDIRGITTKN